MTPLSAMLYYLKSLEKLEMSLLRKAYYAQYICIQALIEQKDNRRLIFSYRVNDKQDQSASRRGGEIGK